MRRWIRLLTIGLSAVILISLILFFAIRNQLLPGIIDRKTGDLNRTHKVNIQYKETRFSGLATIRFDSLVVTASPGDTLLTAGQLSANLSLRHLATGHIRFRKLHLEHVFFNFRLNHLRDYFSKKSGEKSAHASPPEIHLNAKTGRLLKRVFEMVPSRLLVRDAVLQFTLDSTSVISSVGQVSLNRGKLAADIHYTDHQASQTALVEGRVSSKQKTVKLTVIPKDRDSLLHSALADLMGSDFRYSNLSLGLTGIAGKGDILRISGDCSLDSFEIREKALSPKNIPFTGCSVRYTISVGENYIELDSTSVMTLGKLELRPYLRLRKGSQDSVIILFNVPAFTVIDFFQSLPAGLFPHIRYMEAEGGLSYRAKLEVDLHQPDSLRLESKLNDKNFRIIHFDDELYRMRNSFEHTVYEKGIAVRTILAGPENPDFLPLDQIPVLLQQAVLTAEDGSFYGHRGFLISGIQRALSQNIKEKNFSRGGSTISQQLIKNVYLSREKTIARKLEELILVWLIESNRLVSKSRMFEVYLNIIEWGPGVYGAKEAARFYFDKDVSLLNASECIFLASVIPSPKKFYYRYNRDGNLAPFMLDYYRDMSLKLYNKGLLSSSNGDSIAMMLDLVGPARSFLRVNTAVQDSILFSE